MIIGTSTPLSGGGTYTSAWQVDNENDIGVSCYANVDGTLYVDFSNNGGVTSYSTVTIPITAATHKFRVLVKLRRAWRVRYVNGSSAQATFEIAAYSGSFRQPSAPLNATIAQDADAIVTRSLGEEMAMVEGKMSGYSIVNKFGRNTDVDASPEDLWNGGGTYTGFPTGSPENLVVVSDSASDTGTLTFTYLATSTSTAWQTATVTLNGTTPVNTGVSVYRVHTAQYATGAATTFNVGTITGYHQTTTANVFFVMPVGRSQTNVCAYTIPAGSTGYIKRIFGSIRGSGSSVADLDLWVRTLGGSPRLRRPNQLVQGNRLNVDIYGGLVIPAGADVTLRATGGTNLDIIGGFDLVVVKN